MTPPTRRRTVVTFQVMPAPGGAHLHVDRTDDLRKALEAHGVAITRFGFLGNIDDQEIRWQGGLVAERPVPIVTMVKFEYEGEVSPSSMLAELQGALADIGESSMTVIRRSRHSNRDWTDQLHQVRRWHRRLGDLQAIVEREGGDAALDYVNAFFLTCFHLKDWVKQSGHPKAATVEEFIGSHPEMELCRKLCHASKHFELDSGSAIATSVPGKSWVVVDDDGATWEVLTLASRCMALWERFLK